MKTSNFARIGDKWYEILDKRETEDGLEYELKGINYWVDEYHILEISSKEDSQK
ncbi:hypothetical protein ACQUY5_16750 [Bacillus cereus]|uniref:hypothetical protein n=1 Tax=Bacillus cereus TaxID=1396 RepID=UPI003D16BFAC